MKQPFAKGEVRNVIQLGVNSVLFKDFDFRTAAIQIAKCGYDGVELAAIKGMCEHLVLDNWQAQAAELREIAAETGLRLLSMEVASLDEARLALAFAAAAELGIPVVNVGPGGKSDVAADLDQSLQKLAQLSESALAHGVTLCVKAHVGQSIYNTPTSEQAIAAIPSSGFGIDMDPSHIYRANENPQDALQVVLPRVRHVHIRDCRGRSQGPGPIELQACGRGDINLFGYCKVLADGGYDGPICLEVIGANQHALADVSIVAAESYGYLNACLKTLGAR